MKNWRSIVIIWVASAVACLAANPAFDPHWQVGQSFRVRYDFQLQRNLKIDAPHPTSQPAGVTYAYVVSAVNVENGKRVALITATPEEDGWSQWLLTFSVAPASYSGTDPTPIALLRVEEVIDGGNSVYGNPFAPDAWLTKLGDFPSTIIQDFPRIPDTSVGETRAVASAGSSTAPFTQQITFMGGSVIAVLSRADVKTGLPQKTTLEWRTGGIWWSSAQTQLGSDVRVTGTLLP